MEKRPRRFGGLGLVIGIIVSLAIFVGTTYNSLVVKDENVKGKWADVETQYQRRADLIPNLVETVKGYAKHESDTLTQIAKLRSDYKEAKTPQDYEKADEQFTKAINIVVENYPDLKANENFLSLQDELAGTENRIAIARKEYNSEAVDFNKAVRRFPQNIFAGMLGFGTKETFKSSPGAEESPKVDFGK